MEVNQIMYRMRNMRNLTRKEIANKTGISSSYYLQLENGDKKPRPKMLVKIANGMNVPMDIFFMDEGKQFLVNSVIALIMASPSGKLQQLSDNFELFKKYC